MRRMNHSSVSFCSFLFVSISKASHMRVEQRFSKTRAERFLDAAQFGFLW